MSKPAELRPCRYLGTLGDINLGCYDTITLQSGVVFELEPDRNGVELQVALSQGCPDRGVCPNMRTLYTTLACSRCTVFH